MQETYSAGGIVLNKTNKVCLVKQSGKHRGFPKGHAEFGEAEIQTAQREIMEETGLLEHEFVFLYKLGSYRRYGGNPIELKNIAIYKCKVVSDVDVCKLKGELELGWFEKEQIGDLLHHNEDKQFFLSVYDKI